MPVSMQPCAHQRDRVECLAQPRRRVPTNHYPPHPLQTRGTRPTQNGLHQGKDNALYHFAMCQAKEHNFDEKPMCKSPPLSITTHTNHGITDTLEHEGWLSSACFPNPNKVHGFQNTSCVNTFFQTIAPITQAIGFIFEVIDKINYNRYRDRYKKLAAATPLSTLTYI